MLWFWSWSWFWLCAWVVGLLTWTVSWTGILVWSGCGFALRLQFCSGCGNSGSAAVAVLLGLVLVHAWLLDWVLVSCLGLGLDLAGALLKFRLIRPELMRGLCT